MERSTRYLLLPGWMKVLAGVYFIGGILGAVVYAYLWVSEPTLSLKYNLFGQTYPAEIHSGIYVASYAVGFVMIFGAYGLLWGRSWGRVFALSVSYASVLAWVVSFFAKLPTGSVTLAPVQPVIYVFAIFSLHRMKAGWNPPPVLTSPSPSRADQIPG